MTPTSQSDKFKPDEHVAPSGTLEFDDGEQVDFRKSDLPLSVAALERAATDIAFPMHRITSTEDVDEGRKEFGKDVLGAVRQHDVSATPVEVSYETSRINLHEIVQAGTVLVAYREAETIDSATLQER